MSKIYVKDLLFCIEQIDSKVLSLSKQLVSAREEINKLEDERCALVRKLHKEIKEESDNK